MLRDRRTGEQVRALRPQPMALANPNTLSSRYGTGRFPFHTEAAYFEHTPRFLLLFCENPGPGTRPTCLIDGQRIIAELARLERRGTWSIRSGSHQQFAHVLERRAGQYALRYDSACMFPRGAAARREASIIGDGINAEPVVWLHWHANDAVIVDNWRCLHGRGSSSVSDESERVLWRIMCGESNELES